jgi:hypothetical protein
MLPPKNENPSGIPNCDVSTTMRRVRDFLSLELFENPKFPQAKHGLAEFRLKPQNAAHFARLAG